ncbi:MAG: hypothetical protein V3V92_02540 [Candidatus Hydrothermarchaeales archaeon]
MPLSPEQKKRFWAGDPTVLNEPEAIEAMTPDLIRAYLGMAEELRISPERKEMLKDMWSSLEGDKEE